MPLFQLTVAVPVDANYVPLPLYVKVFATWQPCEHEQTSYRT